MYVLACSPTDGATVVRALWKKHVVDKGVDLFRFVDREFLEYPFHPIRCGKFQLDLELLFVLLLILFLFSKLVLVFLLLFFIPISRLAPVGHSSGAESWPWQLV
jgi:hypothetical protein